MVDRSGTFRMPSPPRNTTIPASLSSTSRLPFDLHHHEGTSGDPRFARVREHWETAHNSPSLMVTAEQKPPTSTLIALPPVDDEETPETDAIPFAVSRVTLDMLLTTPRSEYHRPQLLRLLNRSQLEELDREAIGRSPGEYQIIPSATDPKQTAKIALTREQETIDRAQDDMHRHMKWREINRIPDDMTGETFLRERATNTRRRMADERQRIARVLASASFHHFVSAADGQTTELSHSHSTVTGDPALHTAPLHYSHSMVPGGLLVRS